MKLAPLRLDCSALCSLSISSYPSFVPQGNTPARYNTYLAAQNQQQQPLNFQPAQYQNYPAQQSLPQPYLRYHAGFPAVKLYVGGISHQPESRIRMLGPLISSSTTTMPKTTAFFKHTVIHYQHISSLPYRLTYQQSTSISTARSAFSMSKAVWTASISTKSIPTANSSTPESAIYIYGIYLPSIHTRGTYTRGIHTRGPCVRRIYTGET